MLYEEIRRVASREIPAASKSVSTLHAVASFLQKLACEGLYCPYCLSDEVIFKGHVADGMYNDPIYKCTDCSMSWEGSDESQR